MIKGKDTDCKDKQQEKFEKENIDVYVKGYTVLTAIVTFILGASCII